MIKTDIQLVILVLAGVAVITLMVVGLSKVMKESREQFNQQKVEQKQFLLDCTQKGNPLEWCLEVKDL